MNKTLSFCTVALLGAVLASQVVGQTGTPRPQPAAVSTAQPAASLSAAQLEQLAAPIALYPDPLLGQVLTASTYPLELVEAERWLQAPENASLSGAALSAALQDQPWDPTVKALVSFPDVLRQLDNNLQWTEQLGEVFLARQADLMDAVQRLRQRASQSGNLRSTPQQSVVADTQGIMIEPTNPDVVYVPYYDPWLVYGPWPWIDFPPFYFYYPPGFIVGGLIGFGIGIGIVGPWWGGFGWDWHHHGFGPRPRGQPYPTHGWQHDPAHRLGVPYRDAGSAARFQGASEAARRNFRGYPSSSVPQGAAGRTFSSGRGAVRESEPSQAVGRGAPSPQRQEAPVMPRNETPLRQEAPVMPRNETPLRQEAPVMPRNAAPVRQEAPVMPRNSAPAFESFGHGSGVRMDSSRGSSSRSFSPAPSGGHGGGSGGGGGNRGGGGGRRP